MTRRPLPALALLCALVATSASATLPEGYHVLVKGDTVDTRSLPALVALPTGAASTIGLGIQMRFVPHDADDWLLHDTTTGATRVVRPDAFHPVADEATYYDPAARRTRMAHVVRSSATVPSLRIVGDATQSFDELLEPDGSMIFVPEPGVGAGLGAGVGLLAAMARRRRR